MAAPITVDINRLLSQFRGYQDSKRVGTDVANVTKHYKFLSAKRGKLILNTGQECELLTLDGTLPTIYRGHTYQTPMEIFIPEAYPLSPPTCYVRPASGMSLKKGHRHVDSSGLVYLPYLSEWAASSHNLVELCVNMSRVFGVEPPLFASPARSAPVPAQNPARPYMTNTIGQLPQQGQASPYGYSIPQQRQGAGAISQQQQQSPYGYNMPQQRQGAGATPVPPPRPLPPTPEEIRKGKEIELTRKLQMELQDMYNQLRTEMDAAFETQCKLEDNQKEVDVDMEELSRRNKELERLLQVAKERLTELDAYLEERAKEGEPAVEDLIEPRDNLSEKMLSLVAENAAIEDALYYLDVGVTDGVITVEVFLKEVRRLARKQFVARATMKKVETAQRKVKSERETFNADQANNRRGGGFYPSLPQHQQTPPGGRGYMNTPPPRYTPTPSGGSGSGTGGFYPSVPPAYGQQPSPWGASSGRGAGYGGPSYGAQGPHTQRR